MFGLITIVGIVLIVLKALHLIGWSWLWVTLPIWGQVVIAFFWRVLAGPDR